MLGLVSVPVCVLILVARAAGSPSQYVPARSGGWPGWLSGPLHGVGLTLDSTTFQALTLAMCVGYVLVLVCAQALSGRAIAVSIVAANIFLLLGPPLISQDVFGYLEFARLGVLHGLDPYTHVAAEAPTDAVFPFVGWPFQHSPYGPIFTLGSYPLAWLGLAGGLWALKAIAVGASLGAVALTASAAQRMGRSAKAAAAFVGLNPVLLELATGGAHNDTLVLLALAGALALAAGAAPRLRGAAAVLVAGVGVKASAGLVIPFVALAPPAWRERGRVAASAVGAFALLAVVGVVGFGAHAFGFLNALNEQQQLVATHSIPAETRAARGIERGTWLVAPPLAGGLPDGARLHPVAHRPWRRLAGDGGVGDARAPAIDRLAACPGMRYGRSPWPPSPTAAACAPPRSLSVPTRSSSTSRSPTPC